MASITRKPQPAPSEERQREAAIEAVINKGLTRPDDHQQETQDKARQVVLFLPERLLSEVDALVKQVRPRTSRRAWLLEAIREKVERDQDTA
jgi:hypothetical protein